jgi:signal peptidase II
VAVGAVIGGGIGNLLDRLLRDPGGGRGAVIDWIAFDPYSRVFNLADVALRGAALLLIVAAFAGRPRDTPPAGTRGEGKRVPQATTTRE